MTTFFLILISAVILICVWLNNISSRIGVPTLLAFIVLGILFANNGIIPLDFEDRELARETCTVALVFIMFYGGFGTRWESARPIAREAVLLASHCGVDGVVLPFRIGLVLDREHADGLGNQFYRRCVSILDIEVQEAGTQEQHRSASGNGERKQ